MISALCTVMGETDAGKTPSDYQRWHRSHLCCSFSSRSDVCVCKISLRKNNPSCSGQAAVTMPTHWDPASNQWVTAASLLGLACFSSSCVTEWKIWSSSSRKSRQPPQTPQTQQGLFGWTTIKVKSSCICQTCRVLRFIFVLDVLLPGPNFLCHNRTRSLTRLESFLSFLVIVLM